MENNSEKHVMLSYSHECKAIVKIVYEMFKKENIPVWFDDRAIDDNRDDRYVLLFCMFTELLSSSSHKILE